MSNIAQLARVRTRLCLGVLGLSVVAAVGFGGSASAASGTWLSDSYDVADGSYAEQSAVTMAPNGSAAVVYLDASDDDLYLTRKPVGDGWTEPVSIDSPGSGESDDDLVIAVNSSGQVLVGFTRGNGSTGTVRTMIYSPRNPDADSDGLIESASFETDDNSSHPQVALAEDGNALIAWQDGSAHVEDSGTDSHVRSKYLVSPLPNAVEWSGTKSLAYSGIEKDGIEGDANEVALDVNSNGKLVVAWGRFKHDGTGWDTDGAWSDADPVLVDRVIQAVTFDSIQDLADISSASDVDVETISKTSTGSDGVMYYAATPDVEISDNGDAFITWYSGYGTREDIQDEIYDYSEGPHCDDGHDAGQLGCFGVSTYGSIDKAIYAIRAENSESSFSSSELLSDDDTIPYGRPSVGVDASGNATFAWTQYDSSSARETVRTASYSNEGYRDPEGTSGTQYWFDCADNSDGSDGGTCGDPSDEDGDGTVDSDEDVQASSARIATTPDGRPYVIWLYDGGSGYTVKTSYPWFTIEAAAESSSSPLTYMWTGSSAIEDLETLSDTGSDSHASLAIALDDSGNGIASWVDGIPSLSFGTAQINGLDGAGPVFEEATFGESEASLSGEVGKALDFSARVYDIWAEDVKFSWDFADGTISDEERQSSSSRASSDAPLDVDTEINMDCPSYSSAIGSSKTYTWCSDTTHSYSSADTYRATVKATDDSDYSSTESANVSVSDSANACVTPADGGVGVSLTSVRESCSYTTATTDTATETVQTTATTDSTTTASTTATGTEATKATLKIKAKKSQRLRKAAKAYFKKQVAKKSKKAKTRKKLLKKLLRKNPGILTYTASCSQSNCKASFKAQLKIKRKGKKTVTIKLSKVTKTLKKAGKSYTVVVKLTRKQYSKLRKTLKRYGKKAKVTAPVSGSGKTTANGLALVSSSGKTSVKYTAKGVKS